MFVENAPLTLAVSNTCDSTSKTISERYLRIMVI